MNFKIIFISALTYLSLLQIVTADLSPVRTFLQTNLVGLPVIHKEEMWEFDPDVAMARRKQFIELNGLYGDKLIERLGLGIDGRSEERLARQRMRDEGHLGGLNYLTP